MEHVSSAHTAHSFAHEIDLLDVLALDLNTNDFRLFLSPHSIFSLLETIESISVAFEHREFNCKIMTGRRVCVIRWLLSSLFSRLISFSYLKKSLHSLSIRPSPSFSFFLFFFSSMQAAVHCGSVIMGPEEECLFAVLPNL